MVACLGGLGVLVLVRVRAHLHVAAWSRDSEGSVHVPRWWRRARLFSGGKEKG
jgi:hypothetical protein